MFNLSSLPYSHALPLAALPQSLYFPSLSSQSLPFFPFLLPFLLSIMPSQSLPFLFLSFFPETTLPLSSPPVVLESTFLSPSPSRPFLPSYCFPSFPESTLLPFPCSAFSEPILLQPSLPCIPRAYPSPPSPSSPSQSLPFFLLPFPSFPEATLLPIPFLPSQSLPFPPLPFPSFPEPPFPPLPFPAFPEPTLLSPPLLSLPYPSSPSHYLRLYSNKGVSGCRRGALLT